MKQLKRLGQLSIETMIVYGLVILVALSVMGGMLYFNILDLGSYLPDKCDIGGTSDLNCEELSFSAVGDGALSMGIRNIGQRPINLLTMTAIDESSVHWNGELLGQGQIETSPGSWVDISDAAALGPGEIGRVIFTPISGAQGGSTLRATINTQYSFRDGAIVQDSSGEIRTRATGSS